MPQASAYGVESVEEIVVDTYGLIGEKRGIEFDMLCPSPDHNDSKPSCSVNLDSGYWHCFSCGVGGDIVELGRLVLGKPADSVQDLLKPTTPEAKLQVLQRRLAKLQFKPDRRKRRIVLPEYPPLESHPDLTDRQITQATIARWNLGWCEEQRLEGHKNTYMIRDAIAIPIKNQHGENLAWCYRATSTSPSWQPRYLYTPGVEISELWFGLLHHYNARHVTVVEGALDAIWNDQCGFPALALLGSNMGDRKIMWLQHYRSITLLPDRDAAGAQWQNRVVGMLSRRMPLYRAQYRPWMLSKRPDKDGIYRRASDPEELRAVDLEIVHATAVPQLSWMLANNHST